MRSIFNHVARDLLEGYDVTWLQLRRALDTAHLAIDSADLYREVYTDRPVTLLEGEPWRRHVGFPEDADLDPVTPC